MKNRSYVSTLSSVSVQRASSQVILLLPILAVWIATNAHAASATWDLNPSNGDWNTAANWTPPTVPNGSGDTVSFAVSNIAAVSLSSDTEVGRITFDSGASEFNIIVSPLRTLTISGDGISNNSDISENFSIVVDSVSNRPGSGSVARRKAQVRGLLGLDRARQGTDLLHLLNHLEPAGHVRPCQVVGPEPLGEILSRLFAARGWGRRQGRLRLEEAWADAAGALAAEHTRVGNVRRGVLEVVVDNAVLLQELAHFHKRRLLEQLRSRLPEMNLMDLRFRAGM